MALIILTSLLEAEGVSCGTQKHSTRDEAQSNIGSIRMALGKMQQKVSLDVTAAEAFWCE